MEPTGPLSYGDYCTDCSRSSKNARFTKKKESKLSSTDIESSALKPRYFSMKTEASGWQESSLRFPHHIPVDFLPHEYDRRCMDRDRKDIYQSGHAFRNLREVYLCLYRHRIHQGSDRRNPSFLQSVLSFKDMGEMGHLSIHLYKHPTLRSFRCGSIHLCQILKS